MKDRPVIGLTMGDPAGVGPEVIAGALKDRALTADCRPLIIGDSRVIRRALELTRNPARLTVVNSVNEIAEDPEGLSMIDLKNIRTEEIIDGRVSAAAGRASVEYILKGARMALDRQIEALVTAPINKEATRLAGQGELGHLELLAAYCGVSSYATMLVSENLRVVHLTTHYSLKEALTRVKKDYILKRLELIQASFTVWGYRQPVIGVAALNPHGGEGGIIGREEIEEIIPAVQAARERGIEARGPFPADTIFNRALKGEFEVVLALYHDQGHIPIKVHNVEKSLSIALGLPFIRTSVDHGTAFDIAWQGKADCVSLQEAVKAAVKLAREHRL